MTELITVYKSGGILNNYLITLKIDPNDSNLNRKDVVNKDTATYRCRKAFVVKIQHKDTEEVVDFIESKYNINFIYKTGLYVEEPKYDKPIYDIYIGKVCTDGIYFFTTKEPALLYGYVPKKYNMYKSWHDDGQLKEECEYKDRKLEGLLKEECDYKDRKIEGLLKKWHFNGQLSLEGEYKNGIEEGPHKKWYNNGQLKEECEYKNGIEEGPYKSWYDNGKLVGEYVHKNGKIEGLYKLWYENGQLAEEGEFKNGEKIRYKFYFSDGVLCEEKL